MLLSSKIQAHILSHFLTKPHIFLKKSHKTTYFLKKPHIFLTKSHKKISQTQKSHKTCFVRKKSHKISQKNLTNLTFSKISQNLIFFQGNSKIMFLHKLYYILFQLYFTINYTYGLLYKFWSHKISHYSR